MNTFLSSAARVYRDSLVVWYLCSPWMRRNSVKDENLFFDDNLTNNIKWSALSSDYDCSFGSLFDTNSAKNKIQ